MIIQSKKKKKKKKENKSRHSIRQKNEIIKSYLFIFHHRNKLSTIEQITKLSLDYQILSPYTAFVGVETTGSQVDISQLKVRYVPIQIAKDDQYVSTPNTYARMPPMYGIQMSPPQPFYQAYNPGKRPPPPVRVGYTQPQPYLNGPPGPPSYSR